MREEMKRKKQWSEMGLVGGGIKINGGRWNQKKWWEVESKQMVAGGILTNGGRSTLKHGGRSTLKHSQMVGLPKNLQEMGQLFPQSRINGRRHTYTCLLLVRFAAVVEEGVNLTIASTILHKPAVLTCAWPEYLRVDAVKVFDLINFTDVYTNNTGREQNLLSDSSMVSANNVSIFIDALEQKHLSDYVCLVAVLTVHYRSPTLFLRKAGECPTPTEFCLSVIVIPDTVQFLQ